MRWQLDAFTPPMHTVLMSAMSSCSERARRIWRRPAVPMMDLVFSLLWKN